VIRERSGYTSWQDVVFTTEEKADPSMSGEQASPAGDGISNLMKYAMKLDPKSSGVANLPRSSAQDGYLTLTYRKNKLATDLTYTVQVTSDLASAAWQDAGVVISQTDEGEYWMVTVRDVEPMHNHSIRFMRLKVSK
jgi:zona occludens toxin (predicted ATPase)